MCRMFIRQDDKGPLVHTVQSNQQGPRSDLPWRMRLSGPDGINSGRFCYPTQGSPHHKKIQGSHHLPPYFPLAIHSCQDSTHIERDNEAKQECERCVADHGVRIKHYHADTGHFPDNAFQQHCSQQNSSITCCGINAHFQNGVTERAI